MTRPPRRVLLVEINEDGTVGGSHQALFDLVGRLDRQRFTPVVLFYQNSEFVTRLRASGVDVIVWEDTRSRERQQLRAVLGRLGPILARVYHRVRLLRRLDIDLIHINNSPAVTWTDWLPAARLTGVPIISHVRGSPLPPRKGVARWLCAQFDQLLAISPFIRGELRLSAMPEQCLQLVPDGVDAPAVRARVKRSVADVRRELGVGSDQLLAVMAGHLRQWKGQDVVLTALGQLAPALRSRLRVVFAGADDRFSPGYRERLDQLVEQHHLEASVTFLGPRTDVPDLMNASDLVLHASTTAEPFGLVVVEALALGRPVIASKLGGPGDIVTPEVGWTFDPADPGALVDCLSQALEEPSALARRAAAAPARAEVFTIEATVSAVTRIYDQVLSQS